MRNSQSGQSTIEYIGLLALVAAVIGGATVLIKPDIPRQVVARFKQALCIVSGGVCSADQARKEGIPACTIKDKSTATETFIKVHVFNAGKKHIVAIEELSDGTAKLTTLDTGRLGAGVAAKLRAGKKLKLPVSAEAEIGVMLSGNGRVYSFPNVAQAQRAAAALAHHKSGTPLPKALQNPLARFVEGGTYGKANASLDLKPLAKKNRVLKMLLPTPNLKMNATRTMGSKFQKGTTTTYLKGTNELNAALASKLGLERNFKGEVLFELDWVKKKPTTLRATMTSPFKGDRSALEGSITLAELMRGLGKQAGTGTKPNSTDLQKTSISLDLTDPKLGPAGKQLVQSLRTRDFSAVPQLMRKHGVFDVQLFNATEGAPPPSGFDLALGYKLGYGKSKVINRKVFTHGWTARPNEPLRERGDCALALETR